MDDLRAAIEEALDALHSAVDAGDVTAAGERLVDGPVADLSLVTTYVPRPGRAAFAGVIPIGARSAAYAVAGPAVDAVSIARLHRGRDGVWRAHLAGMSTQRAPGETARAALERCAETMRVPAPPRVVRTWAPVPPRAALADIQWLWRSREGVAPAEIDAVEHALGARFPDGYREYVGAFGEAIDTLFLRVYPPKRVRAELPQWRRRVDAFWFWAPADDGFGADEGYASIPIADTLNGDELVFHPDRPGVLYVLPRDEEVVAPLRGGLIEALAWMAESGELGARERVRYAMPLHHPASRVLRPNGDAPDGRTVAAGVVDALRAVDPNARVVEQDDGGATVLLPTLGGVALVAAGGEVTLDLDPSADVAQLERALALLGITHP